LTVALSAARANVRCAGAALLTLATPDQMERFDADARADAQLSNTRAGGDYLTTELVPPSKRVAGIGHLAAVVA
jgi:hypothetical protein